jgi:hypothetical protein
MFGDNKSLVDSSMQLHAKLHKRHTMFYFHHVREAITSGIIGFYFIPGDHNPTDIFNKHWGYSQIKEHFKSILFRKGDTADIMVENSTSQAKGECWDFGQNYTWNKQNGRIRVRSGFTFASCSGKLIIQGINKI